MDTELLELGALALLVLLANAVDNRIASCSPSSGRFARVKEIMVHLMIIVNQLGAKVTRRSPKLRAVDCN
jgi:hypothetical protein